MMSGMNGRPIVLNNLKYDVDVGALERYASSEEATRAASDDPSALAAGRAAGRAAAAGSLRSACACPFCAASAADVDRVTAGACLILAPLSSRSWIASSMLSPASCVRRRAPR